MKKPKSTTESKTVLIGDSEKILIDFISELLTDVLGEKLSIISDWKADNIMDLAKKIHVDLFILVLNNIFWHLSDDHPSETRVNKMIELTAELKQLYHKPIIALAGWPSEEKFKIDVINAGADYFFGLPFKIEPFRAAIDDCLAT